MKGLTTYQKRKFRDNLESLFNMATPDQYDRGRAWYPTANRWCIEVANRHEIDNLRVAGVVSSLSPNNRWERNLIDARAVITAWQEGLPPDSIKVCTYNNNKDKAFRILDQGVHKIFPKATSPKTYSFVQNIAYLNSSSVTVDVWHWRACTMGMRSAPKTLTTKRYKDIEDLTLDLARKHGLKGYEYQAIVWNVIRESAVNS